MAKILYAVLQDEEDIDWGSGSFDICEAKEMLNREWKKGNSDAHIAVIEIVDENHTVCIDTIYFEEVDINAQECDI